MRRLKKKNWVLRAPQVNKPPRKKILACGDGVGVGLGETEGSGVGETEAADVGEGLADGSIVGEGDTSGVGDGLASGVGLGLTSGEALGVGSTVGEGLGSNVGEGDTDGSGVGLTLGSGVGVGLTEGSGDGVGPSLGDGEGDASAGSGVEAVFCGSAKVRRSKSLALLSVSVPFPANGIFAPGLRSILSLAGGFEGNGAVSKPGSGLAAGVPKPTLSIKTSEPSYRRTV